MKKGVKIFIKSLRKVENILAFIAALMLLLLMALGTCDVIGRYFFNAPVQGALEVSLVLMGGMVFLSWAYTMEKGGHPTVDIIFNHYPSKLKKIISFIMMVFSAILFGLIFWESISVAISDWHLGKVIFNTEIPVAPFKFLIPLGALFICLECISQIIRPKSEI